MTADGDDGEGIIRGGVSFELFWEVIFGGGVGVGGDDKYKGQGDWESEQQRSLRLVSSLRSLLEKRRMRVDVGSSVLQDNHDGIQWAVDSMKRENKRRQQRACWNNLEQTSKMRLT